MEANDMVKFITAAGAAGLFAKLVVDGIKIAVDLNRWMPVLLAFVFAGLGQWLLLVSQGTVFTNQVYASMALTTFFAWGFAIGSTVLQTKANRTEEKIQTALDSPAGTTRPELEAKVKEQNQ